MATLVHGELHDPNERAEPGHRVRVAVHAGEVVHSPNAGLVRTSTWPAGWSTPHRCASSSSAGPRADLAFIVSEVIDLAVVRHGHCGVDPASY